MTFPWSLECSECAKRHDASGIPSVCECGAPWLVRYEQSPSPTTKVALATRPWDMWRYREWMPLQATETPISLGEGATPLLRSRRLEDDLRSATVWIKDEAQNPCGSFKSRGMAAAVTRATIAGATSLTVPTAGNAGVSLSAYGQRAGATVKVFAPETTPATILRQIEVYGADLVLIDGHIGDCGKAARAFAAETGATDVSTLREPYRIEGKKTMGIEIAEQLGWSLPDAIIYPTGGGTGLIGMWKAFNELRDAGWVEGRLPRMYSVQAAGCAPVVRAFEAGAERPDAWPNPSTIAWGLRVPGPLGGALILRALRESGGRAVAVPDDDLSAAARRISATEGIDASPEGGAALAALEMLHATGVVAKDESVVLFNTGAGWLYR